MKSTIKHTVRVLFLWLFIGSFVVYGKTQKVREFKKATISQIKENQDYCYTCDAPPVNKGLDVFLKKITLWVMIFLGLIVLFVLLRFGGKSFFSTKAGKRLETNLTEEEIIK